MRWRTAHKRRRRAEARRVADTRYTPSPWALQFAAQTRLVAESFRQAAQGMAEAVARMTANMRRIQENGGLRIGKRPD